MKSMRKLLALVLAVMMVMSLAVNAFATTITIENGASGSQYAAYKLLNVTHSEAGDEANEEDDNFAYTLNDKYDDILIAVTGKTTKEEIIEYIGALDASGISKFAEDVYTAINAADPAIAPDATTSTDKFEDVEQGYYLIAETKTGDAADTYSLLMLDTAGKNNITVKTKEDVPTVDKEVEEVNDSTADAPVWGETADHDLGDEINYRITGTVSGKYADYKSYYYSFTDTMSDGLTYNGDAKVYVVNGETKTEVTDQFVITTLENGFTATSNLKELTLPEGVAITATTTIVVEYTATLNEDAVIGAQGNPNEVILQYENNPYHEADGDNNPKTPNEPEEPGETPKDICIVFTYETIVNKVDENSEALEGAGFTLYKWSAEANDWVAVGEEITGVTTFEFKRLDEGKYKLVETTVPAGYNKAEDIEFEIVSTLDDEAEKLTDLVVKDAEGNVISVDNEETEENEASFAVVVADGTVSTDVVNKTGVELPSTGGIGTTIFYALGGILVLAAVVLLVTKKRMAR